MDNLQPFDWNQPNFPKLLQANGYQTAMIGKIHLDGISRDRYKLIHFYYDVDEWELYDLKTDPMEMRNVYEHPEYAVVREMMHTKLEEVRNYYGDSDVLNEKYLQKYLDQQTAK